MKRVNGPGPVVERVALRPRAPSAATTLPSLPERLDREARRIAQAEAHAPEIERLLNEAVAANDGKWALNVHREIAAQIGIPARVVYAHLNTLKRRKS